MSKLRDKGCTKMKSANQRSKEYNDAMVFRKAAMEDGWSTEPGSPNETAFRYSHHTKDGYTMHIVTRLNDNPENTWSSVSIWGPDDLCIQPPSVYDWGLIQERLRYCATCGTNDVDTFRYSFAGRACKDCLPELKRIHEFRGWCD